MRTRLNALVPLTLLFVAWSGALSAEPPFTAIGTMVDRLLEKPTKAKKTGTMSLGWFNGPTTGASGEIGVRCTVEARLDGEGRKGVPFEIDPQFLDSSFRVLADPPPSTVKTNKAGQADLLFDLPLEDDLFFPFFDVRPRKGKKVDELHATCKSFDRQPCQADATTLCLYDNRFEVFSEWETATDSGEGQVFSSEDDEGLFFFFDPDNTELLVKVLDGCRDNNHFWVFYGATTNVEYTLRVTDTVTGSTMTYGNPLGQASPAITDTSAFATCP